jgi:hypothetical protein|tara:strand:+ start:191 stop:802 length:612 start_codon:yes stop_codon:yes gene_type:complete
MAIVINGSGTVTGISVGGLPDGIVDDGTLATDSVTAAKLKDDAIATGDLPAGSVIQTVFMSSSTPAQITSTNVASPTNTGLSCAITPKVAGSKILGMIDIHLQVMANTTVADAAVGCMVHDGSSYVFSQGSVAHMGLYTYGGAGDPSDEWRGMQGIKFYIDATNTTARTYSVHAYIYPATNSPTVYAQVNNSLSMFTLMEIAV